MVRPVLSIVADVIRFNANLFGLYQITRKRPHKLFSTNNAAVAGYVETKRGHQKIPRRKPWISLKLLVFNPKSYDGTINSLVMMHFQSYEVFEPHIISPRLKEIVINLYEASRKRKFWRVGMINFNLKHGFPCFDKVPGKYARATMIDCLLFIYLCSATQYCFAHHFFEDVKNAQCQIVRHPFLEGRKMCAHISCYNPTLVNQQISPFYEGKTDLVTSFELLRRAIGLSVNFADYFGDFWQMTKFVIMELCLIELSNSVDLNVIHGPLKIKRNF
jgi:hypothetical protein